MLYRLITHTSCRFDFVVDVDVEFESLFSVRIVFDDLNCQFCIGGKMFVDCIVSSCYVPRVNSRSINNQSVKSCRKHVNVTSQSI